MNYTNQNQNPFYSSGNPNEKLTFDQMENNENIYSSKEEEIKTEININIRLGFIRKVYGILTVQLFITALYTLIVMCSNSLQSFMITHTGILFFMFIILIIIPIVIICCRGIMRQVPQNYIILLIFTLAESYCIGFICSFYNPKIVFMAAFMTFVMVLSLTLYAINTNTDITMSGGILFILSSTAFLFFFFLIFTQNKIIYIIITLICVIIFSFYILYDTQLIIGNRTYMIEVDDYILGAFMIYTDIISLFLYLLDLLNLFSDS